MPNEVEPADNMPDKVESTLENLAYRFQKSKSTFGRNERGALDAIGDFFSWSFGIATTKQLENTRLFHKKLMLIW